MSSIPPQWTSKGAGKYLDAPIRVLAADPMNASRWSKLAALKNSLVVKPQPFWFKNQAKQAMQAWGTVAGTLQAMAAEVDEPLRRRLLEFASGARDGAEAVVSIAERRRAGQGGGLWGFWGAMRDSALMAFTAGGLPNPFDPQNALGGQNDAGDKFHGFFVKALWIGGALGTAAVVGPPLVRAATQGVTAGWQEGRQAARAARRRERENRRRRPPPEGE